MSEMDSITSVGMLRQQAHLRGIPIPVLTVSTNQTVRLQALRLGVADYMTKPFDEDELLTRMHNLLIRAQERNQLTGQGALPGESHMDEDWVQRVEQYIQTKLSDSSFQVSSLPDVFHISQCQFYQEIKERTGLSPLQFIQEIRLQTAREWLEPRRYETIKEVAYGTGFQKPPYFAQLFRINPAGVCPE